HRGDALHAKAAGQLRRRIDVHLREMSLLLHVARGLRIQGRHHAAGAAPFGPEAHDVQPGQGADAAREQACAAPPAPSRISWTPCRLIWITAMRRFKPWSRTAAMVLKGWRPLP